MTIEEIMVMTADEKKAAVEEYRGMLNWVKTLSGAQIDFLFNGGWYNEAVKGYLIAAARVAEFSDNQIKDLLSGLRMALSEIDKSDAETIYLNF